MSYYVTCKQPMGRLGNVMFQYAAVMGTAIKHGMEYGFPDDQKIQGVKNLSHLIATKEYRESRFEYNEIRLDANRHWNLIGYFQSYKYFDFCWHDIKRFFWPHPNVQFAVREYIQQNVNGRIPVCIHVRRGDYLNLPEYHPVQGEEYYAKAISYFDIDTHHFFVTSDDVEYEWCKENIAPHVKHISYTGKDEIFDLALGAKCYHNIIANSSFSWWQAWMNENPDKTVIAPKQWFGPEYSYKTTVDLIPDTWQQI